MSMSTLCFRNPWFLGFLLTVILTSFAFRTNASTSGGTYPTLDPTFSSSGITLVEAGDQNPATELLLLPDGNHLTLSGSGNVFMRLPNGQPDPDFGDEGVARFIFGVELFRPRAAVLVANNQILLAGDLWSSSQTAQGNVGVALVRIATNGTLDTTFGTNGIATIPMGQGISGGVVHRMAQHPDGKLVVLVADLGSKPSAGLYQLNADGTPDETFGGDGSIPFAWGNRIPAMVLTPQGIVIAGTQVGTNTGFVARYRATDGAIDTTFGEDGTRLVTFDGFTGSDLGAIVRTPEGALLVAGRTVTPQGYALARLTTTGDFDSAFNGDGKATFAVTPEVPGSAMGPYVSDMVVTEGEITIASRLTFGFNDEWTVVVNLSDNGDVNTGYGENGFYYDTVYGFRNAQRMVSTNDGSVLIGGERFGLALHKVDANGAPNHSYGDVGYYSLGSVTPAKEGRLLFDSAGNAIVFARLGDTSSNGILVSRTRPDGTLDTTYGENGRLVIPNPYGDGDHAIGATIDASDRIIFAGYRGSTPGPINAVLTRITANGAVDTGFGMNGFLTFGTPNLEQAHAVAVDADNRFLVAGRLNSDTDPQALIVRRLLSNGTIDPEFGMEGATVIPNCPTEFYTDITRHTSIHQVEDGKIIVRALCNQNETGLRAYLYRFNEDGSPDSSYGQSGVVEVPFLVADLYVASEGTVTVVGSGFNTQTQYWYAAQYTPAGQPDSTFGTEGVVEYAVPGLSETLRATALDLRSDGTWLLMGYSTADAYQGDMQLTVLQADGNLDTTFGVDGFASLDMVQGDFPTDLAISDNGAWFSGAFNSNRNSGDYALTIGRLQPPDDTPVSRTLYLPLVRYDAQ